MPKRLLVSLLLFVATRCLMDFSYVHFVVPVFGYEGFKLDSDVRQYFISWMLYLVALFITPTKLRKVSDAVFMLGAVLIVAPMTSMYGLSDESIVPVLMTLGSMGLAAAIVNLKFFRVIRLPYIHMGERLAVFISAFAVLIVVLHYLASGVHLNIDLSKVYDFRLGNAESAGGGIFSYLNPWAYQVFNIFLMAVCLMRRRYALMVLLFMVQTFIFAASQHKSVLFSPFVVLGVWWYLRKSDNLLIAPTSILILVSTSLLMYYAQHNVMMPSIAIRRMLFTPAQLSFAYFSFFSDHPKVIWGDSFWMPFVHSPYPVTIPYVIGNYLGNPNMGANNGYVASGFAQAGFIGVLIYAVIFGYLLKFVDAESRRLGATWFGVGLFLLPFMTIWTSSDLATSMFTHGFLVMVLLLGLLRRPERERDLGSSGII